MNSTKLMIFLMVIYSIIALLSAIEGNWPRMFYWLGAMLINGAVLCH